MTLPTRTKRTAIFPALRAFHLGAKLNRVLSAREIATLLALEGIWKEKTIAMRRPGANCTKNLVISRGGGSTNGTF
jgi:hypothetical protein